MKVTAYLARAEVEVDEEAFRAALERDTEGAGWLTRVHAEVLCPIYGEEPFERLECWDARGGRVWIFTKGWVYLKDLRDLREELEERYGRRVAVSKVHALSIRRFLEGNYGPSGAGFLSRVRRVRAEKKRIDLRRFPDPLRHWVARFYGVEEEVERERVRLDRVARDPLEELVETREVQMSLKRGLEGSRSFLDSLDSFAASMRSSGSR